MYYETLLSGGRVEGVWRNILHGTSEPSGEISSSRKEAWEERVSNGERREALETETTLEKEERLPKVQERLSVMQPKILINLSSIAFSIYLTLLSIVNPARLGLFIHSLPLQERSSSVSFLQRRWGQYVRGKIIHQLHSTKLKISNITMCTYQLCYWCSNNC